MDEGGKVRRKYRRQDVTTPYEKLKSLPDAQCYLKASTSFDELDRFAYVVSDLDAVIRVNDARRDLFNAIDAGLHHAA